MNSSKMIPEKWETIKTTYRQEWVKEANDLLHWWMSQMIDPENGGFWGRRDRDGRLYKDANKGVILHSRLLWSFATAARFFSDSAYHETAKRAYSYLSTHFWDQEKGGVFWMLDSTGQVIDTKKQVYAQSFMIYGLSEYYMLTEEEKSLELAIQIFELLEKYSYDAREGGYFEAFDREWKPLDDLRLSEKDANEAKTMNTHLHVLEAYTNLYRVWDDVRLENALKGLVEVFLEKFIQLDRGHLNLFFDEKWNPKSKGISFGHDIEASWLLYEAIEVLGNEGMIQTVKDTSLMMVESSHIKAFSAEGAIVNEAHNGIITDTDIHWWPQVEGMVGFLNGFQLSGNQHFLERVFGLWEYIKGNLKDHEHGEWHWGRKSNGEIMDENKAGPWKAPYHSVRALLECAKRIEMM